MKKLMIILVILGVAWSSPPARAKLAIWSEPVLVRLGPAGDRMLRPMHNTTARNEMDMLLRQLKADLQEGRRLPTERAFGDWLQRAPTSRRGLDPWGNSYYLQLGPGTMTVRSAGVDGVRDTDDDIHRTATY
jgi:hypothetical protein